MSLAGSGRSADERRRRAARTGRLAEFLAAALLIAKGYRILARRFGGKGGEIDLIAARGGTIAFVEVKARARIEVAETSIGPDKQRHVSRAARRWLASHPGTVGLTYRADAVFLAPWRAPRHLEDAFPLDLR